MITYEYIIGTVRTKTINGVDDVIYAVNWSKCGTDENGIKGYFGVSTSIPDSLIDTTSSGFVAYEELTKEMVIGWIEAYANIEDADREILSQIEEKKANSKEVPEYLLPWNKDNPDFPGYKILDSQGWVATENPYGGVWVEGPNGEKVFEDEITS